MHSNITMEQKMGNRFQRGERERTTTLSYSSNIQARARTHTTNVHSIFANFLLDKMRPLFCSVRKLEFSSRVANFLQANESYVDGEGLARKGKDGNGNRKSN